jgi:hypothetical protein
MKGLATAMAVVVLTLGIVAGVIFGLGDDRLLVSPPDVVAQEFVRALANGRTGPAREMLARDAEGQTSNDEMRRISDAFRARIGRVDDVDAAVTDRNRDTAMVRALIDGARRNADVRVPMILEYGQWRVARVSDLVTITETAMRMSRTR